MMKQGSKILRELLKKEDFIYMPVAFDALGGRLVESMGFKAVYTGGFATGASLGMPEPLVTMPEQVQAAGEVANSISIPVVADAGAGFGEPLHTMRTVREFIRAGVAGIHIEDQFYPKRAHYHKYSEHVISRQEYNDKIRFACRQRDETDRDFVIIARTDTTRIVGLEEAILRVNQAAEVGADLGMIFPRNIDEMKAAPKLSKIPLAYAISYGNRDGRPLPTLAEMIDMGYKMCIDGLSALLANFHYTKMALQEIKDTGFLNMMTLEECRQDRKQIEDLKGLEKYYKIEEETVEKNDEDLSV
jgi:2-methylisocitrate lyase-like PEP mutase family enzyme